ncbi:endo-1,4-beta-xylanase [Bacillus sp. AFS031507]|uniref:GH39 family glycosyl hydrolase n=1 Tax=Bacillus sp. AFS031507 TaxID=2033496 RepID=UPI000BFE6EF4|nr:endo-1,4-beta-xylanase [Bacillus sp. AFS031507]PGY12677.1 hypothetical protein COE25_09955 [Bacillus sp. AFS031507]
MKISLSYVIKVSVIIPLLLLASCEDQDNQERVVKKNYFGMHIGNSTKFSPIVTPYHNQGYGSVRFWDTNTNWRQLEPQKGHFNFEKLDQMVSTAIKNHQEILMTLGQPPNWATGGKSSSKYGENYNSLPPTDIRDWSNYVKTIGNRYKGKIKFFEVWNEPNIINFYSGSMEELVSLTREANYVLKKIDPNIKIVSPSTTDRNTGPKFLDGFLKAGGKEFVDVIGVHLYVSPALPEEAIPLIQDYRKVMANNNVGHLPLWDTEFTWLNFKLNGTEKSIGLNETSVIMPTKLASSYLARSLLIGLGMGVERRFFYGLDYPASKIRLIDLKDPQRLLLPGKTYKNITTWLTDSTIQDFSYKFLEEIYVMSILSSEGKKGIIAWTEGSKKILKLPSEFKKEGEYVSVIGENDEYSDGKVVLTNIPILVYED